jgi:hypothetical protein
MGIPQAAMGSGKGLSLDLMKMATAIVYKASEGSLVRQAINEVRGLPKERAIIIRDGARAKVIWRKGGGHDFVPLDELEARNLRGATFIHNHPSGVAPSIDDAASACALGLGDFWAVGKTGYTYHVQPPMGEATFTPKLWPKIRSAGEAADRETRKVFTRAIRAGELTPEDANADHWHTVYQSVADATGIRYTRQGTGHFDLGDVKGKHSTHIPTYDARGVSKGYPPSEDLTREADGTFKNLLTGQHQAHVSGIKPADVDAPHFKEDELSKGGTGSGNFGHGGRPGEVGGSGSGGGPTYDAKRGYTFPIRRSDGTVLTGRPEPRWAPQPKGTPQPVESVTVDQAIEKIRNLDHEELYVFDKDRNEMMHNVGEKGQVAFTTEQSMKIRQSEGVLAMHNHPWHDYFEEGTISTLSAGDLATAAGQKLAETMVVTRDGVYSMRPGPLGWPKEESAYMKMAAVNDDLGPMLALEGTKVAGEWYEDKLKQWAKSYGMIYSRRK